MHGSGLTSLQFRKTGTGGATEEKKFDLTSADEVIQLERKGNTYMMSCCQAERRICSHNNPQEVSDIDLPGDDVYCRLIYQCVHTTLT